MVSAPSLRPAASPVSAAGAPTARTALLVGIGGICLSILLGVVILATGGSAAGGSTLGIDVWWHDVMLATRTDGLVSVSVFLEVLGGIIPMVAVGGIGVVLFLVMRRPWSALTYGGGLILAELIAAVLKVVVHRPRPMDSLTDMTMGAYPSGHTVAAAAVVVALALIFRRRWVWALAILYIVVMSLSRTYLEAHWLTDTIGGALLGASAAMLTWSIVSRLEAAWAARHPAARPLAPRA